LLPRKGGRKHSAAPLGVRGLLLGEFPARGDDLAPLPALLTLVAELVRMTMLQTRPTNKTPTCDFSDQRHQNGTKKERKKKKKKNRDRLKRPFHTTFHTKRTMPSHNSTTLCSQPQPSNTAKQIVHNIFCSCSSNTTIQFHTHLQHKTGKHVKISKKKKKKNEKSFGRLLAHASPFSVLFQETSAAIK
jgi:hypothetical protein